MSSESVVPDRGAGWLRIAVSSPEILAHIRHEFAVKGLNVRIDGLPTVEVLITPVTGTPVAGTAIAAAIKGMAGPHARRRGPATARYRLNVLPKARTAAAQDTAPRASATDATAVLSPREAQVLESIGRGLDNTAIATHLRIQRKTVKNHVNRIFAKLGARNRVEAVLIWQQGRT
ncbi:LuxR C-terminal-related transcriptional regulator [Actinoplanes sp. NBRC 101535]|uniref:helix-turn-helix transcriptional regulator n=1 Tax=Actinoplanes sp. NBRC 101535 TaxID=3032196 RepID=UPI0025557F34|nr:LuxR C-terminal-related transcriptional regulator [Actinoplanes sp. NBRC 101535]